ncbi:hypothetical protein [Maridesulfovibrio ferrireducens]|uniref:hypothetical protein n=1 Tax=Maridesulfovibrio ferrireducens TaxID=246191 RepID=UPI0026E97180|nr:hypothetical protein [Maridesulfovibrio ferrireducens]
MIRNLFSVLFFVLLYCISINPAFAADLPRIMIAGEGFNQGTLSRDSRPFTQVLNSISNSLLNQGFDVKDEVALSSTSHLREKTNRNDAELIETAKDLGIDIVVIFSIYPNKKNDKNTVRIRPRVEGRLVSVYDGSKLGNFDIKSQISKPIEKPYSRNDELEALSDISAILGQEVGDVLAERIAGYVDAEGGRLQEWVMIFDGFNNYEIMDIEDTIQTFSGYDSHRIKSNSKNSERHSELFYRSSVDSAKLKRNMVRMFKKLNLKSSIYISGLQVHAVRNKRMKMNRVQQQNSW